MMHRKCSKKGIAVGQAFIFIVAALTFALIMIFGYRAITDFLHSGEEIAFVQFKTELESDIKKIYTEYGSVRVKSYNPPAQYEQICFVDMDASYDKELCNFNQIACTVWKDAQNPPLGTTSYEFVDENIFLKPTAPVKIKVHRISIDQEAVGKNFLCLPINNGFFKLVLEGKGDRTELSLVPVSN